MPCDHHPGRVLAVHARQVVQEPGQLLGAQRRPAASASSVEVLIYQISITPSPQILSRACLKAGPGAAKMRLVVGMGLGAEAELVASMTQWITAASTRAARQRAFLEGSGPRTAPAGAREDRGD